MKQLTLKLVLPLTLIFFCSFSQWWYVLPVDAPDSTLIGFPLPFASPSWHTSLSWQIFVVEFIVDLLVYFLFFFVLIFVINKYWITVRPHKLVDIGLWVASGSLVSFWVLMASIGGNIYYFKRPFGIEVLQTGFQFFW